METDDDVSAVMHGAVDTVPVRPLDTVALRQRAKRRSLATVLSAAAAAAVVVAGSAFAVTALRRDVPPLAAESCPVPGLGIATWPEGVSVKPGPSDVMVSNGGESMVICRYGGLGEPREPDARTLAMTDPSAKAIVAALNALEPFDRVPGPECTWDDGELYNVVVGFGDGHVEAVAVDPQGCGDVFNGTRHSLFPKVGVSAMLDRAFSG